MANGKITLGKQSGGTLGLVIPDGVANTEVVVPESGTLVSVGTTVTDNAIARFDGTTGAVQNSGVIIDDNGNVGIGVTPSAWSNGYKNIEMGTASSFGDYTGGGFFITQLRNNAYENNGWKYKKNGYASIYEQYTGLHSWLVAPSGTAGNPITWTDAMTLKPNGNLLVGNTTDNGIDKLQVSGGITGATVGNVSGNNNSKNRFVSHISGSSPISRGWISGAFGSNGGDTIVFGQDNGSAVIGIHNYELNAWGSHPLKIITNSSIATPTMTLGVNGNVLIGTSTDNGVDKLQVNGSMSSGPVSIVTDLNEVKRDGLFVTGDFTFSLASNAPCNYGTLHQIARNEGECTQMLIDIVTGKLYTRAYVGSTWINWVEK